MEIKIFKDHAALSAAAAAEIVSLFQTKTEPVLCMASGETPRLTCKVLVERARKEQTDLRRVNFIGLDEWIGIPPANEGSCHFFFHSEIFEPMRLKPTQYHLFDAVSTNPSKECKIMDEYIAEKGGIDLMIVGIGMNGHIGFNEPGISFDKYSHIADLDETTVSVGQKYFKEKVKLSKGITLGLKYLMEAKKVLLIANGQKKASVVQKAAEGAIGTQFPASILQSHPNGIIMVDEEAGSLLKNKN